jgi:ribosome biogenesis protein BMS1
LRAQVNPDSIYKPIERQERKFNALRIPKNIEANLPFKSKPKLESAKKGKSYIAKRAVVMEKDERDKYSFMQALNTLRNEKTKIRKEKNVERMEKKAKANAKAEEAFSEVRTAMKKKRHRAEGKETARREWASKKGRGGD